MASTAYLGQWRLIAALCCRQFERVSAVPPGKGLNEWLKLGRQLLDQFAELEVLTLAARNFIQLPMRDNLPARPRDAREKPECAWMVYLAPNSIDVNAPTLLLDGQSLAAVTIGCHL
jgi:hypothetical protein